MKFSERIQRIQPSMTLAVDAKSKELRANGEDIIGFGAGEPDFDTPDKIKKAGIAAIETNITHYTPVGGIDALKQAIVNKFERDNNLIYEKNQILVSCGAKHSLFNIAQVLWEEGEPVETINEQCKKNKVDLLLLGAMQRENMLKFYMGSIARKLTRNASCSVLLMIKPSVIRKASQHVVVNAFESPETENTVRSAFHFAQALSASKLTLVEEINRSEVAEEADDDRGLRKVTLRKEKLKRRELSRVREILNRISDSLKENIKIHSQNIFGTRGYSIGHYAKVVRADLLIMNSDEKRKGFLERIFPKDLEHILSELPTDVLIIKSKQNG